LDIQDLSWSNSSNIGIDLDELNDINEWKIEKTSSRKNVVTYPCCPEPYHDLMFTFHLQRRSPIYVIVVILPILVVMLLTLGMFWMPAGSSSKIVTGSVNLLILMLLLNYLSSKLPSMANNVPIIFVLYAVVMLLVTVSMLVTIFTTNMSRPARLGSPSWALKSMFYGPLGTFLGLRHIMPMSQGHNSLHNETNEDVELKSSDSLQHRLDGEPRNSIVPMASYSSREWILIATGIDRLCFLCFCVIFGIIIAIMIL